MVIHSLPGTGQEAINRIVLRSGRLPEPTRPEEVVASEAFARESRLVPGSRLQSVLYGRAIELRVVGTAISPDVTNIKLEYNSFREVFEDALDQEVAVTQSIKNIAARCHSEQDFVTMEFLNWFLKEQREEEYKARRALELFEVIGEEGTGRWEIDKHVGKIKYDSEAA